MFQNNLLRGATAALLLFLICIIGGAQEFRGSITGKATDSNGAIIIICHREIATNRGSANGKE